MRVADYRRQAGLTTTVPGAAPMASVPGITPSQTGFPNFCGNRATCLKFQADFDDLLLKKTSIRAKIAVLVDIVVWLNLSLR